MAKQHRTNQRHRSRSKKRQNRPKAKKAKTQKKDRIKDPEFAKTLHKGTQASGHCELCDRAYHYQSYSTFTDYLEILLNRKIFRYVYTPADVSDMTLELQMKSGNISSLYVKMTKFMKDVKQGLQDSKKKLIPIVLNLQIAHEDNHANCLVINKKEKRIELFEPHGHRTSSSVLGGHVRAYSKKIKALRLFWKSHLPEYKVVNVVDEVKRTAFQVEYDPERSTGYCVTWSLLYMHYRILNPDTNEKALIKHIDHKITTRFLLRYARKVEETLKGYS